MGSSTPEGAGKAGEKSIDGDVILSAQALTYRSVADDWSVATENRRHLERYIGTHARTWREIAATRLRLMG